jgi:protein tyrosine/serine phosphatase
MEDMSDQATKELLDSVCDEIFKCTSAGGVLFHCTGGHDRTGIVTAYIRLKYQHWDPDQAIAEMRRYGHEFVTFSRNGGLSSWHEEHLRAIAPSLKGP